MARKKQYAPAVLVDLPLPPRGKPGGSKEKYDWASLKVGGRCLFFPGRPTTSVWNTSRKAAKRHNMKFETRKIFHDGVEGTGVWRVG